MLHLALVQNLLRPSARRRTWPGRTCRSRPATTRRACSWPCCRSARRRCGTSCSWSGPRAWSWTTPPGLSAVGRAEPRSHDERRHRAARRRTSRPSATCTGPSRPASPTWPSKSARLAVRRAAAGPGHAAEFGWPELIAGHRPGQRAARDRRDPGAGRGPARGLAGRALRAVRRDPRRVPADARGRPRLRPGAPGGGGQRPAARARHRGAAHHRPADRADGRPVQRRLRDPAADPGAVLRAHRGDRRPAQDAGRHDDRADGPGDASRSAT